MVRGKLPAGGARGDQCNTARTPQLSTFLAPKSTPVGRFPILPARRGRNALVRFGAGSGSELDVRYIMCDTI